MDSYRLRNSPRDLPQTQLTPLLMSKDIEGSNSHIINELPKSNNAAKVIQSFIQKVLKSILPSLLMGQLLAVLLAGTAICNGLLVQEGFKLPLFQNVWHYTILSIIFIPWAFLKGSKIATNQRISSREFHWNFFKKQWWKYFLAAFLDVHANWAIVAAYAYTNVVSVQMLDCLSIASCMIMSQLIFKVRYRITHFVSIFGCIIGVLIMIWADYEQGERNQNDISNLTSTFKPNDEKINVGRVIIGDIIVICSALAYGSCNTLQEYLVRTHGSANYLAISNLFSVIMELIYFIALEYNTEEHKEILKNMSSTAIWSLCIYVCIMVLLYISMSFLLPTLHAIFTNLSMLTADFYTLLIGLYLFKSVFSWQYIVSFFIIIISVIVFTSKSAIRTN